MLDIDLKSEIKIVDNFFPIFLQKEIARTLLHGNWKWSYYNTITFDDQISTNISKQKWQRHGLFTDTEAFTTILDDKTKNDIYKNVSFYANKHFDIKIKDFIRVMFSYMPPNPNFDSKYNLFPHVDHTSIKHHNILYYINDNDAETVFYNQKFTDHDSIDFEKNEILCKVTPKQGRAVFFDGHIFHSGAVSKEKKRLTLNINFIQE